MPRQRFVVAGAEDTPYRGRASADGMLPAKKADMTITAMSAFPYLLSAGISRYLRAYPTPAALVDRQNLLGFFPVFHSNT